MDDPLFHYFIFFLGLMAFSSFLGIITASANAKHLALHLTGKVDLI
jgi:hypothetical protein